MKWILAVVVMLTAVNAFALDVTIKDIPDGISEQQVKEWVGVLIERFENQKINEVQAVKDATEAAKTSIDTFRGANNMELKFAPKEAPKEEMSIQ